MASRYFKQFRYSLETAITDLFATVEIGAVGVVVAAGSSLIGLTIARSGTGTYLVTLEDPYYAFKTAQMVAQGEYLGYYIDNVDMDAKTFDLVTVDAAGAAADPASGTILSLHVILKNTSVAI